MAGTLIQQKTQEILDLFNPVEGLNTVYYGKVRNGKTYAATSDIIDLVTSGEVVYANWNIKFEGYDERKSFIRVFFKLLLGKPYFYNFKSENLHYLDTTDPNFIKQINNMVGVHLFIDEGQWIFNSHSRTDDPDKRRLILEGGHYCRTLNVITQRPTNILKDVRSQIHFWYKCEKKFHYGKIIRFVRWQIEDMKDDIPIDPDDMEKKPPVKGYWASNAIFNSYNTHGRRSNEAQHIMPEFDVYHYTPKDKLLLLFELLIPKRFRVIKRPRLRSRKPKPLKSKKNWELSSLRNPK